MTSLYKSSTLGLIKRLGVAARWFFVASLSARVFSVFIHLPPIIYIRRLILCKGIKVSSNGETFYNYSIYAYLCGAFICRGNVLGLACAVCGVGRGIGACAQANCCIVRSLTESDVYALSRDGWYAFKI